MATSRCSRRGCCASQPTAASATDVVHSHYWLSGVVGMDLARRWGVPHATTFHTLARSKTMASVGEREPVRRHRMESRIAAEADAIIVSAPYERDLLAHHFDVPPERVRVVPCGVDTTLFRPMGRAHARAPPGPRRPPGRPLRSAGWTRSRAPTSSWRRWPAWKRRRTPRSWSWVATRSESRRRRASTACPRSWGWAAGPAS